MGYISLGPVRDLTFIQTENIKTAIRTKSKNPEKPYCIQIELIKGKSKFIYFALEEEVVKDLRKISVERKKDFKINNFSR